MILDPGLKIDILSLKIMEGHGRSWNVIEGHRRSWKVMEGNERSWKILPDTKLTFQVRKVIGAGVGLYVVSAPVPVPFLWTLDFGHRQSSYFTECVN